MFFFSYIYLFLLFPILYSDDFDNAEDEEVVVQKPLPKKIISPSGSNTRGMRSGLFIIFYQLFSFVLILIFYLTSNRWIYFIFFIFFIYHAIFSWFFLFSFYFLFLFFSSLTDFIIFIFHLYFIIVYCLMFCLIFSLLFYIFIFIFYFIFHFQKNPIWRN